LIAGITQKRENLTHNGIKYQGTDFAERFNEIRNLNFENLNLVKFSAALFLTGMSMIKIAKMKVYCVYF